MFSIIIAEDEDFIRKGISDLILEELSDVEMAGEFSNGESVINLLKKQRVDLVITDIRMPKVDGIEVAKYIYEHSLNIPVIMITAYRNFEYAKDALNYGVKTLITKPIDFDELIANINEVKQAKESKVLLEDAYRASDDLIKKHNDICNALFRFTSGRMDYEELMSEYPENIKRYGGYPCYMIEFRLDTCGIEGNSEWENFCDISNNKFEAFCLQSGKKSASVLLIVYENDADAVLNNYLSEVKKFIKTNYGIGVMSKSTEYRNFLMIPIENMRGLVSLFTGYMLSNSVLADDLLEKLYDNSTETWFRNFLYAVINNLKENVEMDTDRFLVPAKFASDKTEVRKIFYDIQKNVATGSDSKIYSIKAYISAHYSENISLDSVASAFNLNATYLSRMFKKETGEKFADYIIRFKIKKAKELIADGGYNTRQICEKIGYNSVSYFSKVFKTYTGMTLKQYRDSFGE